MSMSVRDLLAALALWTIVYRLTIADGNEPIRMAIAMTCISASWSACIGLRLLTTARRRPGVSGPLSRPRLFGHHPSEDMLKIFQKLVGGR
jgi:hypothetical protein